MKVLVLGAGNVGKAIAYDLSQEFEVWVGDKSKEKLEAIEDFANPIKVGASDFSELLDTMRKFELIFGALPGKFGFATLKAAIKTQRDMVDISFMPENPMEFRDDAEKAQVTIIVDAGFAPGLMDLGRIYQGPDELKEEIIRVGGLPKVAKPPLCYKLHGLHIA